MFRGHDLLAATSGAVLAACAVAGPAQAASERPMQCDDSLKDRFRPDTATSVVAVKAFKRGDPLVLAEPASARTPLAAADLCMVKLNVGPGNPGPAGAPSTSAGIGIEIWLPAPGNWNDRIHALGGNGWSGGNAGSASRVSNAMDSAGVAASEGSVTSTSDSGHSGVTPGMPDVPASGGDFAMDPDGTLSKAQWRDFSSRSLHEQAVKTKALVAVYYGRPARRAYFDGQSQGGRQGLKLAQDFPEDYDGIAARAPAINWTRLFNNHSWQYLLYERELGGKILTQEQRDLVSNAAIRACDVVGGQHLGYVMDVDACHYDAAMDREIICAADGGTNTAAACVSPRQAAVVNRIWYGMTADGSAPSPATDNGMTDTIGAQHRWFGFTRGTSLYNASIGRLFPAVARAGGAGSGHDQVALELQNPTIASRAFRNGSGNGADLWKTLSYAQFDNAVSRGLALQPAFDNIDTANPDLSAFKARGGKILTLHGTADEAIPVQGTVHYYRAVAAKMGGLASVQSFYKVYLAPGLGHNGMQGTSNPDANPPIPGKMQFYDLMVAWVEKGAEPGRVEVASPAGTAGRITQPLCPYPQKATYSSGDPKVTASYKCR
jgi:pimeloyl-ACP methyl ester carboxylesterase